MIATDRATSRTGPPAGVVFTGVVGVVAAAFFAASWISLPAFAVAAAVLAAVLAFAAYRWPRTVLVSVVLLPLGDPILFGGMLAPEAQPLLVYVTEALMLVAAIGVTVRGVVDRTLVPALRHPASVPLAIFVVAAGISAVVNGVQPHVALAGVVFTIDAVALFYLARMATFTERTALLAAGTLVGVMALAALLAIVQSVAAFDILWFRSLNGCCGEGERVMAFFEHPNALGAMLAFALPFPLFAVFRVRSAKARAAALALGALLLVGLLLTFSRSAWFGSVVGLAVLALIAERRALVVGLAIGAVALVAVLLIPRAPGAPGEEATRPDFIQTTLERIGVVTGGREPRLQFIQKSLPIFAESPALGVGPGMFGGAAANIFETPLYAEYEIDLYEHSTIHNFWLHLLVESGIVGVGAYLAMLVVIWVQLLGAAFRSDGMRRALLVAIVAAAVVMSVNSIAEMLLESNKSAPVLWLLLGVGSVLAARERGSAARGAPGGPDPEADPTNPVVA